MRLGRCCGLRARIFFAETRIKQRAILLRFVEYLAPLEQPMPVDLYELILIVPEVHELHVLLGSAIGDVEPVGDRLRGIAVNVNDMIDDLVMRTGARSCT